MDVLSDAVAAMRTGRPHSNLTHNHGPWGIRFPASSGAGFHVVLRGSAWLIRAERGAPPVELAPGDVVFLPHGRGHGLAGEPGVPLEEFALRPDGSWPPAPRRAPSETAPTSVLLCGAYLLNRARAHPLLTDLPELVHLPARVGAHPQLRTAVELLGSELQDPQPGSDTIVRSLLDTLLLYILRSWWLEERHGGAHLTGWAAALTDPAVAAALRAVHGDPAHPWTVGELSAHGGLSRAAFARRFTATVGRPPLAYLTWWRMITAGRLLREADAPLRTIAERAGYTSEFAFAKAFKREYGMAPGLYRKTSA
ncbi:AraC family transcriptional regulator [Streptomyces sp. E11-3]|uniref:AraC family transcriptional regulator n=1 Tax=Streptomyces sp. E11-3 TaxID=3110112 RepID=UPI00397F332D